MSKDSILKAVSSFLNYNADGSVDVNATMMVIQENLQHELVRVQERDSVFLKEINSIFDNNDTTINGLPTKWLCGKVASIVAAGNDSLERELIGEVESFIARSPKFQSRKGRNGGLFRTL